MDILKKIGAYYRKKPIWLKIIVIALSLILILVSMLIIAYSRLTYPTGEIMPGLFAVRSDMFGNGRSMVNFFLFQTGEKYIAIDAGVDNSQTEYALLKLGISADDIIAVFITHSDWDHIGSLDLFNNAIIYTGFIELPNIYHQIMTDEEIVDLY